MFALWESGDTSDQVRDRPRGGVTVQSLHVLWSRSLLTVKEAGGASGLSPHASVGTASYKPDRGLAPGTKFGSLGVNGAASLQSFLEDPGAGPPPQGARAGARSHFLSERGRLDAGGVLGCSAQVS